MGKNILFLTGTRADFGKVKPLIERVEASQRFECSIFVTGMHTLSRYGYTVDEIYKSLPDRRLSDGFRRVHTFMNQIHGEPMEQILANTIHGLSRYVHEFKPDMIVVHGDRVEALAGATVGALRNILVGHIEGGELSGTVDELIRHAVSKLAHVHFVANAEAGARLKQLGEREDAIFVIGSPDIDIMLDPSLPSLEEVTTYYEIPFDAYAVALFHPVTTDPDGTAAEAEALVSALLASKQNYVVIYPNNDEGSDVIFHQYERLKGNPRFVVYPSLRMESFLTLLRHARFIIGNSSVGIREAPVYGVYSIDVGCRQSNRFVHPSIMAVPGTQDALLEAIGNVAQQPRQEPSYHFGKGDSADRFMDVLNDDALWEIPTQKQFVSLPE